VVCKQLVVGDEEDAEVSATLFLGDDVEEGGLGGDVQHGGHFVADEVARFEDEGSGEAGTLELAVRDLVWVALAQFGEDPEAVAPLLRTLLSVALVTDAVGDERLHDDLVEAEAVVAGLTGGLPDELDESTLLARGARAKAGDRGAVQRDGAGVRCFEQGKDAGERGLAGAALADDREALARVELDGDAVQRTDGTRTSTVGSGDSVGRECVSVRHGGST